MTRIFLFTGGVLNLGLALFKITMPYIFHWREAMGTGTVTMWSTLLAENLGISMLMLFFAFMSIFQWQELQGTGLGKTALLSISTLFVYRAVVEILVYKIGVDGAWWRVILFLIIALFYLVPLLKGIRARSAVL